MRQTYTREQRHICGSCYQEVDIYTVTQAEHRASLRAKKRAASKLVQQNANAARAERYLVQLVNTNFDAAGVHMTLTYREEQLPDSPQAAEHLLELFLRRVRARCAQQGAAAPKYIAVTEYRQEEESGALAVRYHHHVILSCALGRDELEDLWRAPGKGGERLGTVNADRLQPERGSLERLCRYLIKYPNRKRRWKQSRGLKKPDRPRPNDTRYSRRQTEKIVRTCLYDRSFWEKQYPGWNFSEVSSSWNEWTGHHITLKLWRPPQPPKAAHERRRA